MAKAPVVGMPAPDFELAGTDGAFRLSQQRGKKVVLLFYPGDNTPVCTKQFCSYRDDAEELSKLDAIVVGISDQPVESHAEFLDKHRLTVPLLADTGRAIAKLYGVSRPVVGTRRAVFIVDEQGILRFVHKHALGLDFLTVDDLRRALNQASEGAQSNPSTI